MNQTEKQLSAIEDEFTYDPSKSTSLSNIEKDDLSKTPLNLNKGIDKDEKQPPGTENQFTNDPSKDIDKDYSYKNFTEDPNKM